MTESEIQDRLFKYFNAGRGYTYQLCNAYIYAWESDFWCLASSGYAYEIEVKSSRTDFFQDFNKTEKHSILSCPFDTYAKPLGRYSGIIPNLDKWEYKEDGYYHYTNHELNRHARKKPPVCKFKRVPIGEVSPNRFYYAVPDGLIEKDETPDYAGLIYTHSDGRRKPSIIKRAPTIHATKNNYTELLLEKYYWAYLRKIGKQRSGKNFQLPGEPKQPSKSQRKKMRRTK